MRDTEISRERKCIRSPNKEKPEKWFILAMLIYQACSIDIRFSSFEFPINLLILKVSIIGSENVGSKTFPLTAIRFPAKMVLSMVYKSYAF
jgi:hypothetical protein